MNDYFAGNLARERQADYLREIAHDELVARVRRPADAAARRWHAIAHRGRPDRVEAVADSTRSVSSCGRRVVKRVVTLIAVALLTLTIAGPVAADPINKAQFPHVYVTTCADGTEVPDQSPAHATPGWDINWQPGDTPWLLLAYKVNDNLSDQDDPFSGVTVYTRPLPSGLEGKVYGPCTMRWQDATMSITDAYFLKANQHAMP